MHLSSCSTRSAVHLALANKAGETYSEGAEGIQLSVKGLKEIPTYGGSEEMKGEPRRVEL